MKAKEKYTKVIQWDLQSFYNNWGLEGDASGKWEIFAMPFLMLIISILSIIIYPYYVYKNVKKYRNIHWEKQ